MKGIQGKQRSLASGSSNPEGLPHQQKNKRHCGRWWWVYAVAIFVMVAIIIVFPVLYVAFPNNAQDMINHADFFVTNQSILSPTAESFYLEQTIVFETSSGESASLDEWKGSFCLDQQCQYPFAEIDVPESQAKNDTQVQISQEIQFINMTEFNEYIRVAFGSEECTSFLEGQGKFSKGAWPTTTVHYNKNITMKGLNALKDFNVTAFHIVNPPLADGTNANGTIRIPNPSISAYELGDLALNMSVDGMHIGTAFLQNVFLGPDDNPFPMTAITNEAAIVELILGKYQTGVLPVDFVAISVVYRGQHVPWYEQALGALMLRVDLNVAPALHDAGLAAALGLEPPTSAA